MSYLSDPTITTILVVGVYLIMAGIGWSHARSARRIGDSRRERRTLGVALVALLLALSYQLELIPRGIALAKAIAKNYGWYGYRWPLALLGIQIFVVLAVATLFRYQPRLRRFNRSHALMGLGCALLAGYFLLRATSLHWVEPWSGIHFGCPRTNPWIEWTGALLITAGLWRTSSTSRVGGNRVLEQPETRH